MTGVDILKAIGLDNASLGLFNRFIAKKAYKLGKMNSKAKKIVKNKWHVITESGQNVPANQREVLVKLSSGKIRVGYYFNATATTMEKGWYLVHSDPAEPDVLVADLGLFVIAWRELPKIKEYKPENTDI
jgi:Zn-dependent oligopeptidase